MKKFLNVNAICIMAMALCYAGIGCKKDNTTNPQPGAVSTTLSSGAWRVTSFIEDNVDETSDFSGYTFTFASSGGVAAVKSGNTTNGTWSAGNDDSKVKLVLDFGSTDPLEELNEDWRVMERTDTKVRLQHTSGGDGSIDYLTFEKN